MPYNPVAYTQIKALLNNELDKAIRMNLQMMRKLNKKWQSLVFGCIPRLDRAANILKSWAFRKVQTFCFHVATCYVFDHWNEKKLQNMKQADMTTFRKPLPKRKILLQLHRRDALFQKKFIIPFKEEELLHFICLLWAYEPRDYYISLL